MSDKNTDKFTHSINRHMFPEFANMTDEEAWEVMDANSKNIEAEYNRAEAWVRLEERLRSKGKNPISKHVLGIMDSIYKEVEEESEDI